MGCRKTRIGATLYFTEGLYLILWTSSSPVLCCIRRWTSVPSLRRSGERRPGPELPSPPPTSGDALCWFRGYIKKDVKSVCEYVPIIGCDESNGTNQGVR